MTLEEIGRRAVALSSLRSELMAITCERLEYEDDEPCYWVEPGTSYLDTLPEDSCSSCHRWRELKSKVTKASQSLSRATFAYRKQQRSKKERNDA